MGSCFEQTGILVRWRIVVNGRCLGECEPIPKKPPSGLQKPKLHSQQDLAERRRTLGPTPTIDVARCFPRRLSYDLRFVFLPGRPRHRSGCESKSAAGDRKFPRDGHKKIEAAHVLKSPSRGEMPLMKLRTPTLLGILLTALACAPGPNAKTPTAQKSNPMSNLFPLRDGAEWKFQNRSDRRNFNH